MEDKYYEQKVNKMYQPIMRLTKLQRNRKECKEERERQEEYKVRWTDYWKSRQ